MKKQIEFDCANDSYSSCYCSEFIGFVQKLYYSPITKKYYKLCTRQLEKDWGWYIKEIFFSWKEHKLIEIKKDPEKICKKVIEQIT